MLPTTYYKTVLFCKFHGSNILVEVFDQVRPKFALKFAQALGQLLTAKITLIALHRDLHCLGLCSRPIKVFALRHSILRPTPHKTAAAADKLRRDSRRAIPARKVLISLCTTGKTEIALHHWKNAPALVFPQFYPRAPGMKTLDVCQRRLRDGGVWLVVEAGLVLPPTD